MQHNRESIVQIHLVEGKSGKLVGVGSGFFVEREKVVTNIHAIYGEGLVSAKSVDGEMVWEVEGVTAFDVKNDLVILKVSGEGKPLPLGNSDAVEDYTETITLKSDCASVYYNRGLARQALGLQEEAQADFDKAAELN